MGEVIVMEWVVGILGASFGMVILALIGILFWETSKMERSNNTLAERREADAIRAHFIAEADPDQPATYVNPDRVKRHLTLLK